MGYILPVTNYQYSQYVQRDVGSDQHPFQLLPVARINREGNILNPFQAISEGNRFMDYSKASGKSKSAVNQKAIADTYAEITGTGKHFSKTV